MKLKITTTYLIVVILLSGVYAVCQFIMVMGLV